MSIPIGAADQQIETNVQKDTSESEAYPETLDAHVKPEGKA